MSAIFRFLIFFGISVFFAAQGLRFQRRYRREVHGDAQLDVRSQATRRVYARAIVIAYAEATVALAAAFYLTI